MAEQINEIYPLAGKLSETRLAEELQGQSVVLKECIEQLGAAELSRAALISHLKEALREQVGFLGGIWLAGIKYPGLKSPCSYCPGAKFVKLKFHFL